MSFTDDPTAQGLVYTMRASDPDAASSQNPSAPSEPLSDQALQQLLSRAPKVEGLDGDRVPFALRPGSTPPPRPGSDVHESFPPPPTDASKPTPLPADLHVLRHFPDGDVPMAPNLSVTFDHPMIAVTSADEAAKQVPLTVIPEPKGQWHWLGTRTLAFEPDPRFPMATEYKVEIPAGTTAADGSKLKDAVTFTFRTPPPTVQYMTPSDQPTGTTPVVLVKFDQRMDPAVTLGHIDVSGPNGTVKFKVASDKEIADAKLADAIAAAQPEGSIVAISPVQPLPPATHFSVRVNKGTPSAEGPRTSSDAWADEFWTYEPLRIVTHGCGQDVCPPEYGWYVEFDNPIDATGFDPSAWTIDPPVPGVQISAWGGTSVNLYGQFQGRTEYTITVPSTTKDTFGQTLGKDQKLKVRTGPAQKTLEGPSEMTVLDPAGQPKLSVFSTNHGSLRVRVHEVKPGDWDAWSAWVRSIYYDDATPKGLPGKSVVDTTIKVDSDPDHKVETAIDFTPYLHDGHGQFVVLVEPTNQPANRWERQYVYSWVQVTDLGLTAFADQNRMVAWVDDLGTGAPVGDATVSISPEGASGTSDKQGVADLSLPTVAVANGDYSGQVLVATRGSDTAILPQGGVWGGHGWIKSPPTDSIQWWIADDRGTYKPGEKAYVKGWMRRVQNDVGGDVVPLSGKDVSIAWTLTSAVGDQLGQGTAKVSDHGGFDIAIDIPKNANLGNAWMTLTETGEDGAYGQSTSTSIMIQEFRRPEFEVSAVTSDGPFLLGEDAKVTVNAAYYAGGGLQDAPVSWYSYASAASFSPPGHDGYSFGGWVPFWSRGWGGDYGYGYGYGSSGSASLATVTNSKGESTAALHFQSVNPKRPMNVHVQASVQDVDRQAWVAETNLLVHPADRYIGLKSRSMFYDKGVPIPVDAILVDLDGNLVSDGTIEMHFARMEYGVEKGLWGEHEKDPVDCEAKPTTDDKSPGNCTFTPEIGGSYRVLATVTDAHGRQNESELRLWVAGGDATPSRTVTQEAVTLIPEREDFKNGDTARILVMAPFPNAEAMLTLRRNGLVESRRFRIEGSSTVIEVPITEAMVPNVNVQVNLVGQAPRLSDTGEVLKDVEPRLAYAQGSVDLRVPAIERTLSVLAVPAQGELLPGEDTKLEVVVKDAHGKPIADAELLVVVADEAILALSGHRLPDPIDTFYMTRPPGVSDYHLRGWARLANPATITTATGTGGATGQVVPTEAPAMEQKAPEAAAAPAATVPVGGLAARGDVALDRASNAHGETKDVRAGAKKARLTEDGEASVGGTDPIDVRTDFTPVAVFAPNVRTDASGRATIPVDLPDTLTRYRVMVVAVDKEHSFGSAESSILARMPLAVRLSAPRFLNFGDQFELPIVVQNQTAEPLTVDVGVRASNLRFVDKVEPVFPDLPDADVSAAGRRVTVPPHDRVEVRFPAVTSKPGTARIQAIVTTKDAADAAEISLPVWTPATTEAFATYGELEGTSATMQPVKAPDEVWPQFGQLEVTTSSTELPALTDAFIGLATYPYDCNEQLASRVLSIAALRDVLDAFGAEGLPSSADLESQVQKDLERLHIRHNEDGGWAFWRRGDESWPYLTIHVAHAYAEARDHGYTVDDRDWATALDYLQHIDSHIPDWYSEESRRFLESYAVLVRHRMGDDDPAEAKRILNKEGPKGLGLDSLGFLLPVLDKANQEKVLTYLNNNATEEASMAHFVTSYSDGAQVLLHSDRRADGIVLDALLETRPDNDLIPKVARGLLAHRTKGRWANTNEDVFILLSLRRYFEVHEKVTPNFVARAWLGDGYLGEHEFKGRTTERDHMTVPLGVLTESKDPQPLTIGEEGAGRMYYRIGLTYAPKSLDLESADRGFVVERTYEAIDNPSDVLKDAEGTWHIKAGARVRVKLSMTNEARRYHVALVDPLPAGLEAINPELAVNGSMPQSGGSVEAYGKYGHGGLDTWWWWGPWYDHENMRDERVEAFSSMLWDGVHEYTYTARATTPGRFVVPPAKAEEMYAPETFGRSSTDRVIVE